MNIQSTNKDLDNMVKVCLALDGIHKSLGIYRGAVIVSDSGDTIELYRKAGHKIIKFENGDIVITDRKVDSDYVKFSTHEEAGQYLELVYKGAI